MYGFKHGGIIIKELPQHSFTIVVSEASTPPTVNSPIRMSALAVAH